MIILGISAFVHDSGACIIRNGSLISFVEEERLNRIKHTNMFPELSIQYVLSEAGLKLSDVDIIAFNWNPFKVLLEEGKRILFLPHIAYKTAKYNKPPKNIGTILSTLKLKRYLHEKFKDPFKGKIVWVMHHLAHAASSYYLSNYKTADILVVDAHGENCSTSFFRANNNKIIPQFDFPVFESLGIIYTNFTRFLGFDAFQEGKLMALASYGNKNSINTLDDLVKVLPNGKYSVDKRYLGWWKYINGELVKEIGKPRACSGPITQYHKDLAACMQHKIKEAILHILAYASEKSKNENLCLSGGLFLNCDINKSIVNSLRYKNVFIPPITSDCGGAMGAALYAAFDLYKEKKDALNKPFLPFNGPQYSPSEIGDALKNKSVVYTRSSNVCGQTARYLYENKIIGWFHGRMECGPRALGNRSILANPCTDNIQYLLNSKIKKRDGFLPFAPIVTEEAAFKYFETKKPVPDPLRYMLLTVNVKEEYKNKIPGVVHVDGTARIQVVDPEWNPLLQELLQEFEKLSGFAVLINTSFNKQEPIVCSPDDAIATFCKTGLDVLVIEDYIVKKRA